MKKHCNTINGLVGIGAVLLVASTALFAQSNSITNVWCDVWASGTISVAPSITIGPVSICTTNGAVTIDEGVTMDEASKEFWRVLEKTYPACFPRANSLLDRNQTPPSGEEQG